MKTVSASVPGKVLVSGGYLILDPSNKGLVLSTTARFKTTVSLEECSDSSHGSHSCNRLVSVYSKQFRMTWEYSFHVGQIASCNNQIEQLNTESVGKNVYIETTVSLTLAYFAVKGQDTSWWPGNRKLFIVLAADNDFYSQKSYLIENSMNATRKNLKALPNCLPIKKVDGKLAKTGMGSSAALISSLVGALYCFFKKEYVVQNIALEKIHKISQICHCVAQGKVGSGFDVSAAIFGSQTYQRFSPDKLQSIFNASLTQESITHLVENQSWDYKVVSCRKHIRTLNFCRLVSNYRNIWNY